QIAVALLDHIAEMDADAKLNVSLGRNAGVALDHAVLHLDSAAYSLDYTAELDEDAIASALDHAPVMHGDGRINQIAPQRAEPRQCAILVDTGKSAVTDHVGGENGGELSGLGHRVHRNNPERNGEFGPAEIQEGYHALNRTFLTFFTVVLRRKAHSFATRNVAYWPDSDLPRCLHSGRYQV